MHIRPVGISELDHFFWKVGGGGRGRASPPDFQNLIISINYLTSNHKYKYIWIWILIDANIELLAAWMLWKERNNRVLQRRATKWFTPWSSLPTWSGRFWWGYTMEPSGLQTPWDLIASLIRDQGVARVHTLDLVNLQSQTVVYI